MADPGWNPAQIYDGYRFAGHLPRRGLISPATCPAGG
jgi:hypothetical protein